MDFYIVASCINIYAIHLSSTFVPIRRLKINVKLKEYHVDWNNTNKLFYLCKNCAIETHSRDESNVEEIVPLKLFFCFISISRSVAPGLRNGLEADLRRCTFYEWNSMNDLLFSRTTLFQEIASAICLGDFLRVVNETRCKWNIREITDKDRND